MKDIYACKGCGGRWIRYTNSITDKYYWSHRQNQAKTRCIFYNKLFNYLIPNVHYSLCGSILKII